MPGTLFGSSLPRAHTAEDGQALAGEAALAAAEAAERRALGGELPALPSAVAALRALAALLPAPPAPPPSAGERAWLALSDVPPPLSGAAAAEWGAPSCVAASARGAAVGTSSGAVLLGRSRAAAAAAAVGGAGARGAGRGDPQPPALAGAVLPTPSPASPGCGVTCVAFGPAGEWLLVGHADGALRLWDAHRASLLKDIRGAHSSPLVCAAVTRPSSMGGGGDAVTADATGVCMRHSIATLGPVTRVRTTSLAEKTRILDLQPLPQPLPAAGGDRSDGSDSPRASADDPPPAELCDDPEACALLAVVTPGAVLLMRLHPASAVVGRVGRGAPPRPDAASPPPCAPACAWAPRRRPATHGPATLGVSFGASLRVVRVRLSPGGAKAEVTPLAAWEGPAPVAALTWPHEAVVMGLTHTRLFVAWPAAGGQPVDVLDAGWAEAVWRAGGAAAAAQPGDGAQPPGRDAPCVAAHGACLYALSPDCLRAARLVGWRERAAGLAARGDAAAAAIAALAVATHSGDVPLPPPSEAPPGREAAAALVVVSMLCRLLDEALPEPSRATPAAEATVSTLLALAAAVPASRDLLLATLFGPQLLGRFEAVGAAPALLRALLPPIHSDALPVLPPGVVRDLISAASAEGAAGLVESAVLHLTVASLDFDQVARLCAAHGLHAAHAHLFTAGLGDWVAPADAMLAAATAGGPTSRATALRLLLFLRESFRGRVFPPGRGDLPPDAVPRLKATLLRWLLGDVSSSSPSPSSSDARPPRPPFPVLCSLLRLDAGATLSVLGDAFDGWDAAEEDVMGPSWDASAARSAAQLVAEAVMEACEALGGEGHAGAAAACLGFVAAFVGAGRAAVPPPVLRRLATALAAGPPPPGPGDARRREGELLCLLRAPGAAGERAHLQALAVAARFWQAQAALHCCSGEWGDAMACCCRDEWYPEGAAHLVDALLGPPQGGDAQPVPPPRPGTAAASVSRAGDAAACVALVDALIDNLPAVAAASPHAAASLVARRLPGRAGAALRALGGVAETQFAFLEALFAPSRAEPGHAGLAALLACVPPAERDALAEAHLAALCRFAPASVAPFLAHPRSHPTPTAHALRLVRAAGLRAAEATLLERQGRWAEALRVLLRTRADALAAATAAHPCDARAADAAANAADGDAAAALAAAVGLCSRVTPEPGAAGDEEMGTAADPLDTRPVDSDSPTALWLCLIAAVAREVVDSGGCAGAQRSLAAALAAAAPRVPPHRIAALLASPSAQPGGGGALRAAVAGALAAAHATQSVWAAAKAAAQAEAAHRGAAAMARSRHAVLAQIAAT